MWVSRFDEVAGHHGKPAADLMFGQFLIPLLNEDSKQLFVAADESLGLHVYAPTRDQLVDEVVEQLMFLWETFGCGTSERLTEDARQLRTRLRARIREAD